MELTSKDSSNLEVFFLNRASLLGGLRARNNGLRRLELLKTEVSSGFHLNEGIPKFVLFYIYYVYGSNIYVR